MSREPTKDVGPTLSPLAYSASQLADKLGVSLRHIRRMDSAGLLPKPIRLGRSVRWPADTIHAWVKAGAPDRKRWEQMNTRPGRGRGHE